MIFRYEDAFSLDVIRDMILSAEEEFPVPMQASVQDVLDAIHEQGFMIVFGFIGDRCIGNIYGSREGDDSVYIYNLTVRKDCQGKGLGKILMRQFLERARVKGYLKATGDFRHNAALRIAQRFGARCVRVTEDWEGTGEPFTRCIIDLAPG